MVERYVEKVNRKFQLQIRFTRATTFIPCIFWIESIFKALSNLKNWNQSWGLAWEKKDFLWDSGINVDTFKTSFKSHSARIRKPESLWNRNCSPLLQFKPRAKVFTIGSHIPDKNSSFVFSTVNTNTLYAYEKLKWAEVVVDVISSLMNSCENFNEFLGLLFSLKNWNFRIIPYPLGAR